MYITTVVSACYSTKTYKFLSISVDAEH